jgi:8-hydroxy-5-deazaflavin:NADPH oxidoreductase
MKIAVVGRGNVGGGLADLWEKAGHDVTRIGREGGDVSEAEVVLVAVPGGTIAQTLDNVQGIEEKTVIDATNLVGTDPPESFSSNAEYVKSRTNGPTAKSFNTNFAALYDRIGEARSTPSNLWCGDEEARQVVEQLNRDAGYEPAERVMRFREGGVRSPQSIAAIDGARSVGSVTVPEGSRSESGTLVGVGPGLCLLPRRHILGTRMNDAYGPMPKQALISGMSSSCQLTP